MKRTLARLGIIGAAATFVGMVAMPPAMAVSWNSSAPTKATSVKTVASYALGKGGADGTLQIRRGSYSGKTYYWGRISNPKSMYNGYGYYIWFQIGGINCPQGSGKSTKDINKTSYTKATQASSRCTLSVSLRSASDKLLYSASYGV